MFYPARLLFLMLVTLILVPVQSRAADATAPIERFVQVDDRLFRGAQPDVAGFKYLRDLGVRTIINLREAKDGERLNEREIVESLGMKYVNIPVKDGNFFTRSRRIIESVFLHELVHALRAAGHELYVVAPKREQSWIGAAKSRN